jgi:pentatricopeptide repeat protein
MREAIAGADAEALRKGAQPQVGQRQRGRRRPGAAVQGDGKLGRAGSTEGAATLLQQMQQASCRARRR